MKGKLFKTGISMLLASAMMITSIPATSLAAAAPKAGDPGVSGVSGDATPILDTALANYDFNDFSVAAGDAGKLTDGTREITLEALGGCKKPELKEKTGRGKVLALTEQGEGVEKRGDALLPSNPFAGQSVEN